MKTWNVSTNQKEWVLGVFACYMTLLMVIQPIRFIPETVTAALNTVSYVVGIVLILAALALDKPFLPRHKLFPLFCILAAFFLAFGVTIIINRGLNLFSNVKGFVATAIQMFLLFFVLASSEPATAGRVLKWMLKTLLIATLFVGLTNIVFFVGNINDQAAPGRVRGLFDNPNNASLCLMALLGSIWLLRFEKGRKWFYILSIVVELIAVIISDARSLVAFLFVTLSLFAVIYCLEKVERKVWISLLIAAGMIAGSYVTYQVVGVVTSYLPGVATYVEQLINPPTDGQGGTSQVMPKAISRTGELEESSTDVRISLLLSGWNTFKKHAVFGVSPRNLPQVVAEENPDQKTQGIEGGGLHNAYAQLLVANGAAGFLLVVAIGLWCLRRVVRGFRTEVRYGTAFLVGLLTFGMFEYSLIFANTSTSLFFWALLGYTVCMALFYGRQAKDACEEERRDKLPADGTPVV